MHPHPPPLTIGSTVLKESVDLDILGVTFDSKLTCEKHLRSVSRAASQRLCILRKSWRVFHDRLLIGRCFWGFVLPVLEYCSAVWCLAADTHRVVSGACFLAGGVLNCNLSHHRSVAMLQMLYKIRCNPMHPLCGALPVPYVPVQITRGTLITHRYIYEPPCCRTSQYCRTFVSLSVSLQNDLVDPIFDFVRLVGFKSRSNAFLLAQLLSPFLSNYFPFLFFSSIGWQCGAGVFGLIGCQSPSPGLALPIFLNINNNKFMCILLTKQPVSTKQFMLCAHFNFFLILHNQVSPKA